MMDAKKMKAVVIDALEDIKAKNILMLNVSKLTSLFDYIVVATGDSNRQTKALANNVKEKAKEAGGSVYGSEGEETGEWVLVDLGDVVVHIMLPAIREYYRLEELWRDGKVEFPKPEKPAPEEKAERPVKETTKEKKPKAGAKTTGKATAKTTVKAKAKATGKSTAKSTTATAKKKTTTPRGKTAATSKRSTATTTKAKTAAKTTTKAKTGAKSTSKSKVMTKTTAKATAKATPKAAPKNAPKTASKTKSATAKTAAKAKTKSKA
jgi:ribosome-associated protein